MVSGGLLAAKAWLAGAFVLGAAVDGGVAITPDVVTAQIEGAIGFALSAALRNHVTLNKGRVEQDDFDDREPTRMREMPKVEVYIEALWDWRAGRAAGGARDRERHLRRGREAAAVAAV